MKSSFTKFMKNITEYVMKLWHVMKHSFAPNQDHPTSPPSRCHDFFSFWRLPQPGNSIATKSPYGGDWGMWLWMILYKDWISLFVISSYALFFTQSHTATAKYCKAFIKNGALKQFDKQLLFAIFTVELWYYCTYQLFWSCASS